MMMRHTEAGLLVLVLIGLPLLLILRKGTGLLSAFSTEGGPPLPRPVPASSLVSRVVEALALAGMGGIVILFTATNRSTGGMLADLDRLSPALVRVHFAVAAVAAGGVLLGVLFCLFWRTSLGVIVSALVLCVYGLMLNGPGDWMDSLAADATPSVRYTITLNGGDYEGAEVWVNGVMLGTAPVETTLAEFARRVPVLEVPPEAVQTGANEVKYAEKWTITGGWSGTTLYRWAEFDLPEEVPAERHGPYYVRLRLNGEWGLVRAAGSGYSGSDPIRSAQTYLTAVFPERRARLERLLDRTRLADYRPDAAWFRALESYGTDGLMAMRRAPDWEEGFSSVLDRWARLRYELEGIEGHRAAWDAFQHVMQDVDARDAYSTASRAGRAVEYLVPHLDPERVAREMARLLRRRGQIRLAWWQEDGELQFGLQKPGPLLGGPTGSTHTHGMGGSGGEYLPSAYALAHAALRIDQRADREGGDNPVERIVVPQLIRSYHRHNRVLVMAAWLGGKTIADFLLRQNWRRPVEWHEDDGMSLGGGEGINRWLYIAAHLSGPAGREFRQRHLERVMDLAEKIARADHESRAPDFLFYDLDRGPEGLAARFCPRYLGIVAGDYDALENAMGYLVRMEPVSTLQMYRRAWRRTVDYGDGPDPPRVLGNLPTDKQVHVLDALIDEVEKALQAGPTEEEQRRMQYWLRELREMRNRADGARFARLWVERLENPLDRERYLQSVIRWLAQERPDHALVEMLAGHDLPILRAVVPPVAAAHPSPRNRRLLAGLEDDPARQVREAAREAGTVLGTLKETAPAALGADGSWQTTVPSERVRPGR